MKPPSVAVMVATLLAAALALASPVQAQDRGGVIDFNAYWDTRSASTFTVNSLAALPGRVEYFSFVNYSSPARSSSTDLEGFYSEHHLRWTVARGRPFELTSLWNPRSGADNDALYLGFRIRFAEVGALGASLRRARISYALNPSPLRLDSGPTQGWTPKIAHTYRWDPLPGQLYLSGFADHALWIDGPSGARSVTTVTEHQIGARLWHRFYAVVEWRLNQTLPDGQQSGFGFGLQYLVPFILRP